MAREFADLLTRRTRALNTFLCVGIDPIPADLPRQFQRSATQTRAAGVLAYAQALVEATAPHAVAFKPQIAHFAAIGAERELAQLIETIHVEHPEIPVLLDAKRGDIGSTAALYAEEAYQRYNADAVTVSPFLGQEGIAPFLAWEGRGVIVLCRTSNPDSDWLQQGEGPAAPFRKIAKTFGELGADNPNIGLVVGATQPRELEEVRSLAPDVLLLVPGIGAQGGDPETVLRVGQRPSGGGLLLNVSRGIFRAWREPEGAAALTTAAATYAEQMRPG
ncbi:MAG: orotidine-5'-phosphate decarboxylase [Pseudomonadota bacterium]